MWGTWSPSVSPATALPTCPSALGLAALETVGIRDPLCTRVFVIVHRDNTKSRLKPSPGLRGHSQWMPLAQTTENAVTKKREKSLLEGRRSFQLGEGSNGPVREQRPPYWSCVVSWCRRRKGLRGILRVRRSPHSFSCNRSCWNTSKKVTVFRPTEKCGAFFSQHQALYQAPRVYVRQSFPIWVYVRQSFPIWVSERNYVYQKWKQKI